MCGRIACYSDQTELEGFIETKICVEFNPSYNICPTDQILIIVAPEKLEVASWGLIPPWSKDKKRILINARSETINETPSFKDAFGTRRCLVLINGFFEWKREKGSKPSPYYISSSAEPILTLAGIFNVDSQQAGYNVSVITTEANQLMSEIHDRMPVILSKKEWSAWFDPSQNRRELSSMLKPYQGMDLGMKAVGGVVSDVRNKSKECLDNAMG